MFSSSQNLDYHRQFVEQSMKQILIFYFIFLYVIAVTASGIMTVCKAGERGEGGVGNSNGRGAALLCFSAFTIKEKPFPRILTPYFTPSFILLTSPYSELCHLAGQLVLLFFKLIGRQQAQQMGTGTKFQKPNKYCSSSVVNRSCSTTLVSDFGGIRAVVSQNFYHLHELLHL